MKRALFAVALIVCGALLVVGIGVGLFAVLGKERVAGLPLIGDAFNVVNEGGEIVEVDDARYKEVEELITNLKAKIEESEALRYETEQTNERLKQEIKRQASRITALNNEINEKIVIIASERAKAIEATAKTYESTDPSVVAEIFREMGEDEEVAEILMFMRDRQAAKVIEAYAGMGGSEEERRENTKRIADITKIRQKLVLAEDLSD